MLFKYTVTVKNDSQLESITILCQTLFSLAEVNSLLDRTIPKYCRHELQILTHGDASNRDSEPPCQPRGRDALPRVRRGTSENQLLLFTGPQSLFLNFPPFLCACSRYMNIPRRIAQERVPTMRAMPDRAGEPIYHATRPVTTPRSRHY